jgi:hypothetical protein
VIAWQTRLVSRDIGSTMRRLAAGTFAFVSPGAVVLQDRKMDLRKGALLRDPDGHAVMLMEK